MDCVVSPVDHKLSVADEEVRTTELPLQKVVGPPAVMVGTAGFGLTVTLNAVEFPEVQPAVISSTV